jgi:hypothetical protein
MNPKFIRSRPFLFLWAGCSLVRVHRIIGIELKAGEWDEVESITGVRGWSLHKGTFTRSFFKER